MISDAIEELGEKSTKNSSVGFRSLNLSTLRYRQFMKKFTGIR
jgi:hypothetical protein